MAEVVTVAKRGVRQQTPCRLVQTFKCFRLACYSPKGSFIDKQACSCHPMLAVFGTLLFWRALLFEWIKNIKIQNITPESTDKTGFHVDACLEQDYI